MDEISAYIQEARAKRKNNQEIETALISAGWDKALVEKALHPHDLPVPHPPVTGNPTAGSGSPTSAWIAFEHILLFISLYVLSMSVSLILHYFTDKWAPGVPSLTSTMTSSSYGVIILRGYLAATIVSLPMFSIFFLTVTKQMLKNPIIR